MSRRFSGKAQGTAIPVSWPLHSLPRESIATLRGQSASNGRARSDSGCEMTTSVDTRPEPGATVASQVSVPAQPWTPPTWASLVHDHSGHVYRLAFQLTGNRPDAEDLTQDVFLRAFRSLDSFEPGTLRGWLRRIATNLFVDDVRRGQRMRMGGLGADGAEDIASGEQTPAQRVAERDLDHDVADALAALSPENRAAVVLRDVEGWSYDEIAAALDVKRGTVCSRIHRARTVLRVSLAHRSPTVTHSRYLGLNEATRSSHVSRS